MYRFIFIFILIIAFILLYNILSMLFNVESNTNKRAYQNSIIRKKKLLKPKYMFAKYIKLSHFKTEDLRTHLFSLNIDISPEEYVSANIFETLVFLPFIVISILLKNNAFSVLLIILSVLIFIDKQEKINKLLTKRRRLIEEEAPGLIRYFIVSLNNTSDIKEIFKNYLEISGYLKRDIELVIIDMNSMRNNENNLVRSLELLDDRLNTPIMSDFITGLINVTMGKNQESYFALLERELKELSMHNLKLKTNKIEKNIRKYFYVLVIFFIILAVTEFIIFIKASIIF